ncbi:zinc ribbon domain-containing protein [Marinospirillum sp.]|uniref:zinc ribbon domain-containing protein n=1 Tax=Marinospirillum sp. TaxID=2183934 RepID=UPI00345A8F8F
MPLTIPQWQCPACLADRDRDVNAALNLRAQGMLKLKAAGLSASANGGKRKTSHLLAAA